MEHSVIKDEPESPSDGHVQLDVYTDENLVHQWPAIRMGPRRAPIRVLNSIQIFTLHLCYCRNHTLLSETGRAFCSVDCYIASLAKKHVKITRHQRNWVELTMLENKGKNLCYEISDYDNNAKLLACRPLAEQPGGVGADIQDAIQAPGGMIVGQQIISGPRGQVPELEIGNFMNASVAHSTGFMSQTNQSISGPAMNNIQPSNRMGQMDPVQINHGQIRPGPGQMPPQGQVYPVQIGPGPGPMPPQGQMVSQQNMRNLGPVRHLKMLAMQQQQQQNQMEMGGPNAPVHFNPNQLGGY